ncbi:MAG: indole-3-glycerol phosphate synthase TrpC [Bacteroidota bacterium]
MNILDTIVARKKAEVDERKKRKPLDVIKLDAFYIRNTISLVEGLSRPNASGIIAEFKRKSPSKGVINDRVDLLEVTKGYQDAGASAVSILTDEYFFGGDDQDVVRAREVLDIPILRKEFIIDEYQVHEAKALGADLILLIAACLTKEEVVRFSTVARSLGLEVLLELHDEDELGHVCETIDLVGINNRSLKTFDVNIARSLRMAGQLPKDKLKVAESGIDDPAQVKLFRENGYSAFLIGENFMKTNDPGMALNDFRNQIELLG